MSESSVLFEIKNGIGWITLNRPRVLNSLDIDMVKQIEELLNEWKTRSDVAMVGVIGSGDKGFCAGGDMRALYDQQGSNIMDDAYAFFTTEYRMDKAFQQFPKPVLVYMNGVVMGGGVGIAEGASHRIVTETTKWAMPEMNIGFFPDVGSSYFLNRLDGYVGRYLALTSTVLKAEDVLHLELADYYLEESDWPDFLQKLTDTNWTEVDVESELHRLLSALAKTSEELPPLKDLQANIDHHFSWNTVEEIVDSLGGSSREAGDWQDRTRENLLSKSPTSLKVALRQLQKGTDNSYVECLQMELDMAMNFMAHDDFYEGVRSVLVDKDRAPVWEPASLEDVSEADVEAFFRYEWSGEHPLASLNA